MSTGKRAVEGFFPATSMPDPDWWNVLWPDPHQVLVSLGIGPGMDAIDLCCGDGLSTAPLASLARRVIAIDLDPSMLEQARQKVAAQDATHCEFVQGNAYDVASLVPWTAGAALIANTFHGVPDRTRLAQAVAAVLKPRGRFIVVNWHRRPREETTVLGQARGPRTADRDENHPRPGIRVR